MSPLHTVHSAAALTALLARCGAGDTVLLLGDGVYAALAASGRPLLALREDLAARGLADGDLAAGVTAIDMEAFVALAAAHQPILAWF